MSTEKRETEEHVLFCILLTKCIVNRAERREREGTEGENEIQAIIWTIERRREKGYQKIVHFVPARIAVPLRH